MKGTVLWFNPRRGFGFIHGEDNTDYFAHFSRIKSDDDFKSLYPDQSCEFGVSHDDKGRILATDIVPGPRPEKNEEADKAEA